MNHGVCVDLRTADGNGLHSLPSFHWCTLGLRMVLVSVNGPLRCGTANTTVLSLAGSVPHVPQAARKLASLDRRRSIYIPLYVSRALPLDGSSLRRVSAHVRVRMVRVATKGGRR